MSDLRPVILDARTGTPGVPPLSDYAAVSRVWNETEFRATLEGSESVAGYWEGEPGWVEFERWPYHEICVVLSGRVSVVSASGERATYSTGAAFLIPKGFSGRWVTEEPTRKIFVGIVS